MIIILMNKIENKQGAGGHCNSNRPFSLPVYTAHLIHEKWGCMTASMSQGGVYVCMYSLLPWSGASFVLPMLNVQLLHGFLVLLLHVHLLHRLLEGQGLLSRQHSVLFLSLVYHYGGKLAQTERTHHQQTHKGETITKSFRFGDYLQSRA